VKSLVMLILLIISLICMGYGYFQMYLDTYIRPFLGVTTIGPNPLISALIAVSGTMLLFGLYIYTDYQKRLISWEEERCPYCGKKVHAQED
jgi:predicted MFS family arabinose efflux permease